MEGAEPLPIWYRDRWISARWYKEPEGLGGYLLRCPKCDRTFFAGSPPFRFKVTRDRRLTIEGIVQCPRWGCTWRGTIERGVVEDA